MKGVSVIPQHGAASVLGELGDLHAAAHGENRVLPLPFITISREPGAGGKSLARDLVNSLNTTDGAGQWSVWDGELVEKVAADNHLSTQLVERLNEGRHTSPADYLGSLLVGPAGGYVDDGLVFARLSRAVRAIAAAGRAVIVGRGGVFITRHFPGGIHLRLVAPLEWRIKNIAREMSLSEPDAEAWIDRTYRQRKAYYHRHWPGETPDFNAFTLAFNTAQVTPAEMVAFTRQLVLARSPAPA